MNRGGRTWFWPSTAEEGPVVGYWRASGPIAPDAPPAYVACTPERFISHNPDYSCERMEGWSILEVG